MAYPVRNPIVSDEFDLVEDRLINQLKGRYHCRGGVKDKVDYYAIIFIDPNEPKKIMGHLTGPFKNYAKFEVFRGKSFPRYKIMPLSNNEATVDKLEQQIKHAMKSLYNKVKGERYSGPMNKDNWKGFYPKRSRGLKVGPSGQATLDLALKMGEIDESFKETCLAVGIYMEFV